MSYNLDWIDAIIPPIDVEPLPIEEIQKIIAEIQK